eukprot:scaffold10025_cov119-Isochrysis_galbana.AAC.4
MHFPRGCPLTRGCHSCSGPSVLCASPSAPGRSARSVTWATGVRSDAVGAVGGLSAGGGLVEIIHRCWDGLLMARAE